MQELEQAQAAGVSGKDWQAAPLGELVKHIVATHHEYLKLELPALGNRLDKVHSVHGARDPATLDRTAGGTAGPGQSPGQGAFGAWRARSRDPRPDAGSVCLVARGIGTASAQGRGDPIPLPGAIRRR